MYCISKIHMQMHWCHSPLVGPSSQSHCKFALENSRTSREDLQVKEVLEILTNLEPRDWLFPYINFVLYSILPDNPKEAAAIIRKAPRFYYNAIMQTLYHRLYDEILLQYLSHKEAQEVLQKAHDGMGGAHQS